MARVALRSLLLQKLRSLLSVLGVVCGVTAVVAMISIGEGAKQETIHQIEQLGANNIYLKAVELTENQTVKTRERLSQGLTVADMHKIRHGCAAVENIACVREISASILGLPRELMPQVVACSADYAHLIGLHISDGRFISPIDHQHRNLVCVLGSEVARSMEGQGSPGSVIRINNQLVQIVGILNRVEPRKGGTSTVAARNFNEMVFVPLETADTLYYPDAGRAKKAGGTSQLSEIVVQIAREEDVMAAAELITRIMTVSHHDTQDYQVVVNPHPGRTHSR